MAGTLLLLAAAGPAVGAQSARDSLCFAGFEAARSAFGLPDRLALRSPAGACTVAATVIQLRLLEARRSTFNAEEVQRRTLNALHTSRGETSGTPGEAAAAIEPVESAGGEIGALAAEGGSSTVTALAINPAFFLVSARNERAVAKWSRFSDFTLLVPTSDSDQDDDGDVDYVGVRWRININGLGAGDALLQAVTTAFQKILQQGTQEVVAINELLIRVPAASLESCLQALMRAGSVGQTPEELAAGVAASAVPCGGSPFGAGVGASPYQELDESIRRARVAADSRYFGLDIQAHFGDLPRFGVDTLAGRSLTVGVGFGRRYPLLNAETSNGVRGSLGIRFLDPKGSATSGFAATGGLQFEMVRYYDHQRLSASAGLEFQAGSGDDGSPASNDFLAFRGSINVPLAGITSATVSFGTPIAGGSGMGPTLSVKANWRLLFPGPQ